MTVKFEIKGGRELEHALSKVGAAVGTKNLEFVALKALTPMLSAVERGTPIGTEEPRGELRAGNGKQIWSSEPRKIVAEVFNSAPHAHLVEFGHRLVRGGAQVGSVGPHAFFRPAIDTTRNTVLSRTESGIRFFIERTMT